MKEIGIRMIATVDLETFVPGEQAAAARGRGDGRRRDRLLPGARAHGDAAKRVEAGGGDPAGAGESGGRGGDVHQSAQVCFARM